MKKAYIKLFSYEDKQKTEGMLLAYALEDQAPVLVDLYHGERIPDEIRDCFLDKKTEIYLFPKGKEIDGIVQSLHLRSCRAVVIDLYRRMKWLRLPLDPLAVPESMGLEPFPCSYTGDCLLRFRTADTFQGRRIFPDEYPAIWKQVKEYLRWVIRAERTVAGQMDCMEQDFPYGEIFLRLDGGALVPVELHKLENRVRLDKEYQSRFYWKYQEWDGRKQPVTYQAYAGFLKKGYQLVQSMERNPQIVKRILEKQGILEDCRHYEGRVDLPGQLFELSSVPMGKQMVLADYGQVLWQVVLCWAGERRQRVKEEEYPLICGDGVTGYFRHGLPVAEHEDMKKKIDEWRMCHPKLTSFWDDILKAFWYTCNTKKTTDEKVLCLFWENDSLVVRIPSGRRLYFQKAELIYEKNQWMLCVAESDDGKTERKKRYFLSAVLEQLAEAAVEEIVIDRAQVLRKMGACVVCTSRRKLLFYMDREAVQIQDRRLLKRILRLEEMELVPSIFYGGGKENAE